MTPALEKQMEEAYGLNDPIHEQYLDYLVNALNLILAHRLNMKDKKSWILY